MGDTKVEYRFFSVARWKDEQEFLREQHNSGWEFVRLDLLCRYHFRRCSPEDVVYQLDFNPEGLEHKAEYVQMFRDCGWEYLQDYAGYSYFRKPVAEMNGDEEIFCDDASRLDFMNRVFKRRLIPLIVIYFCIIIPQIFVNAFNVSPYSRIFVRVFAALAVIYLALFVEFAVEVRQYKKNQGKG